jgi:hypothetical protein
MSEKVTFSAFDPVRFDAPLRCDVCDSQAPAFHYEYCVDEATRQSPKRGFCCSFCAMGLLQRLQRAESRAWAEEEASLRAEDLAIK